MATYSERASCLSADPHDDIRDPVLHYFGCLEAWQRDDFFDTASPYWIKQVKTLKDSGILRPDAERRIRAQRGAYRNHCAEELHRVSLILSALAADEKKSYLLTDLASSLARWRSSRQYELGIELVRKWRADRRLPNGAAITYPKNETGKLYNPHSNIKVQVIAFKEGLPCNLDPQYATGTFPNQVTNVHDLLRHEKPLLSSLLQQKRIDNAGAESMWIHIPSNNMLWVEEVIARYYGEEKPTREQMRDGDEASRTSRLLRDYFWRGQEYGDSTKPSSHFMRPFSEFIAPSRRHMDSEAEKVVLYAPYLHWETSRQLNFITRKTEESMAEYTYNQRRAADSEKRRRMKDREGLKMPNLPSLWPFSRKLTFAEPEREGLRYAEPRRTRFQSKHPLGQYLLGMARLYEEVRNYEDTSLIQRYLFANPPLHPRRTLDQGYYTTVRSTRARNRTQVLYRATTPAKSKSHQFDSSTGLWTCPRSDIPSEGCDICRENVRKVSSVVMVDQLWMWVLSPQVVITCFPKRYGLRGPDPSGVFEAVQKRLIRDRPIRSVFAIAQTILDECSDTLFRRMKDFSEQPPVLDLFSEAIQDVSRKQTLETRRLWDWIDRARRINRQQEPHQTIGTLPWTMNTEGNLEQEIQDIVEELEIMISLTKTQFDVYKKFIQHASRFLEDRSSGYWCSDGEALWFGPRLLVKVEERIRHLESLLKDASSAADLVKDLSQLRQQQDSVVQALQSVKLSLDSMDQGRTVMVFTIVTIIFSPLSFLSSIFGMNNAEFGNNQWKVADQLKLILSISVGVTALALVFASRRVRAVAIYVVFCIAHPLRTSRRVSRLLGYGYWRMRNMRETVPESSLAARAITGV
ncbi:hypothetical protein F5B22DRAFT_596029 [Xylaria bambusicola]|uniref:uncharacterized protein n=1 Tax=Xylaria bambusicola TaxID=326684 RepID=UPI002007A051|nr:uncharacterized protein F5B22DRAFT_596029 [Xylaria bambusicola]KAI0521730.1 hypothetical protein F5B22DRAFT_596029 [Xylaria bambusicola]